MDDVFIPDSLTKKECLCYNGDMISRRRGFTLVEVSLFLAITSLIFVGIVAGTQNSIYQQRYNDAVQSFADFLRNNYSQVLNVQSDGTGNSDDVIYGRIITFGNNGDDDKVISYSVIGKDTGGGVGGGALGRIITAGSRVGKRDDVSAGLMDAGLKESYIPKWGSKIQFKKNDGSFDLFKGAIMIIRHPETGTVYTYVTDDSVEEGDYIEGKTFITEKIDLCVNPGGNIADGDGPRKDVRVVENARNVSGVVLVPDDDENNGCK